MRLCRYKGTFVFVIINNNNNKRDYEKQSSSTHLVITQFAKLVQLVQKAARLFPSQDFDVSSV